MSERVLDWEGMRNARDLGGLPAASGLTRRGAVVRAGTPALLTPAGWAALHDYGIRTIVTLSTHGMTEPELSFTSPYAEITVTGAAIEDVTNLEFRARWASSELWCTPLYYADALRLWPERHAAAITAIARAGPGGVLFHCARGQDRTGIIALLLLSLVGVEQGAIIEDYTLSLDPGRDALLAEQNTSAGQVLRGVLAGLDVEAYLRGGGATQADLDTARRRLNPW